MIAVYRLYRFRRSSGLSCWQALKPRSSLPTIESIEHAAWWSGWWTSSPVFFVIGIAVGVMLVKH
jgi:hypothetical protein